MEPKYLTLNELFQNKLFKIPSNQRTYSWTKVERSQLFQDLENISKDEDVTTHHFMSIILLLKDTSNKKKSGSSQFQVVQLFDGQQRITTLSILLKSIELFFKQMIEVKKEEEGTAELITQYEEEIEYIHDLLIKNKKFPLLEVNHDDNEIFSSFLKKGDIVNIRQTIADKNILDAIYECKSFLSKWNTGGDVSGLLDIIKNRLAFILHETDDERVIYRIFETINSRGRDLDYLDKFRNVLMASAFKTCSKSVRQKKFEELNEYWSRIYKEIGLFDVSKDEILKFATTLKYNDKVSKIVSGNDAVEFLRTLCNTENYEDLASIIGWVESVTKELKVIYADNRLSALTKIAHARILLCAIQLIETKHGIQLPIARSQWENVTFRIFGLCRKDSRTKVGEYVRAANTIIREFYGEKKENIDSQIAQIITEISEGFDMNSCLEQFKKFDDYQNGWEQELVFLFHRYENALTSTRDNELWNIILESSPSKVIEHVNGRTNNKLGNLCVTLPNINKLTEGLKFEEKKEIYLENKLDKIEVVREVIEEPIWNAEKISEREVRIVKFIKETFDDVVIG